MGSHTQFTTRRQRESKGRLRFELTRLPILLTYMGRATGATMLAIAALPPHIHPSSSARQKMVAASAAGNI